MRRLRNSSQVATALHDRRRILDASLPDVAKRAGMQPEALHSFELGFSMPSISAVIRIADALGYDLALIPREETP